MQDQLTFRNRRVMDIADDLRAGQEPEHRIRERSTRGVDVDGRAELPESLEAEQNGADALQEEREDGVVACLEEPTVADVDEVETVLGHCDAEAALGLGEDLRRRGVHVSGVDAVLPVVVAEPESFRCGEME